MKERKVLVADLRKAAKARKRGGKGQRSAQGKVTTRLRYEICVQKCIYGCAWAVYDQVVQYAKLETSELCYDWKSVAQGRRNRIEIVGGNGGRSVVGVGRKQMFPRRPLQLASDMRPYTQSTEPESDEFSKYVVETELMEKRPKSV